jgi:hypothetical protein
MRAVITFHATGPLAGRPLRAPSTRAYVALRRLRGTE